MLPWEISHLCRKLLPLHATHVMERTPLIYYAVRFRVLSTMNTQYRYKIIKGILNAVVRERLPEGVISQSAAVKLTLKTQQR